MNDFFEEQSGRAFGWIADPAEADRIAKSQPMGEFVQTPIAQQSAPLPEQVFLWELARTQTGNLLAGADQGKVGACVAFGTARAIQYTTLAEISRGDPDQSVPLVEEAIYAASRVEIGQGRLGRADGSTGAWAAEAVRKLGILKRGKWHGVDLSTYDEARCRQWGQLGVPKEFKNSMGQHPVRGITRVKTWEEAKRSLASGHAIAVCSRVGFVKSRDAAGFCERQGTWGHCLCLCGYQTGQREGGRFDNSWGPNFHTGPLGAGNPGPEGFYADAITVEEMLAEGDSWAFSAVEGFPDRGVVSWWI